MNLETVHAKGSPVVCALYNIVDLAHIVTVVRLLIVVSELPGIVGVFCREDLGPTQWPCGG